MKTRRRVSVLVLALAMPPSSVHAQARGAGSAAAETLFQQAVALMNDARLEQACAKFEGSLSLDPALGTLLRLGDCYDRLGKTASAWTTFQDAVSLARNRQELDRQQIASERVADLERRLSWVRISLAATESTRDLSLLIDGTAVSLALLESPIPFDPGSHRIELSASGRRSWSQELEVVKGPARQALELPHLEAVPSERTAMVEPARRAEPEPERPATNLTPWGIVVGGAGLIGLGVGGLLSYQALRSNHDARSECDSSNRCSAAGVERRDRALAYADGATVAMIAGGVLLAGGLGLILWSPGDERPAAASHAFAPLLEVSTAFSPRGAGLELGGRF